MTMQLAIVLCLAVTAILVHLRQCARDEQLILDLLRESDPEQLYGLELVERSNGRLGRGTIYIHLGRLEDRGLVHSWKADRAHPQARPKRLYGLTDKGRAFP